MEKKKNYTVKVEWGGFNAGVLGLDEEVEIPAGLKGVEVYDYLEDMYGFRPSSWKII